MRSFYRVYASSKLDQLFSKSNLGISDANVIRCLGIALPLARKTTHGYGILKMYPLLTMSKAYHVIASY